MGTIILPNFVGSDASAWIRFAVLVAIISLNYYAVSRIIRQAGYSGKWILLPLSPFILTFVIAFWEALRLRSMMNGGISYAEAENEVKFLTNMWKIDMFLVFANWIFFICFAFMKWPVSKDAEKGLAARFTPRPLNAEVPAGFIVPIEPKPPTPGPTMPNRSSIVTAVDAVAPEESADSGSFALGPDQSPTTDSTSEPSPDQSTVDPPKRGDTYWS